MAIDYRCYDIRNLFFTRDVALLWCEVEEITPTTRHMVRSMICAIREALSTGELVCDHSLTAALTTPPHWNEAAFTREELQRWAISKGQKPKFLFPEMRDEKNVRQQEKRVEQERKEDKASVQAVARTLWDIFPDMTAEAIANHQTVKIFCNGAQWEMPTIKSWIREIDPRPKDKRAGRPRKSAKENIQPNYEDA